VRIGWVSSERGLLDTSVVIDLDCIPEESLPADTTISAVTLGELSGGLHTPIEPKTRAERAERLQRVEANLIP
jgi:predicted nucleic acid-binding protein